MKKEYEIYTEITKAVLDSVKPGDLVKFNDWKLPYRVKGVSENYFVAARKMFGKTSYTICEIKPWPGIKHNAMTGGMFHIGPDNMVFGWGGWPDGHEYDFDDEDATVEYLKALENGEIAISERRGCPIHSIAIKRA